MAFEQRRKLAHTIAALALATAIWYTPEGYTRILLTTTLLAGLAIALLEQRRAIPIITPLLDELERPHERRTPGKGPIMLVAGALATSLFFNDLIVTSGLLVLALADSLGAAYGNAYGRIVLPWDSERHIEGRILGFMIAWGLLVGFWTLAGITPLAKVIMITLLGALAGVIVESMPLRRWGLDDNLVVPIIVATTLYLTA